MALFFLKMLPIIWKWDWIDDNFEGGTESSMMSDIQVIPETPPQIDSNDESILVLMVLWLLIYVLR